MKRKIYYLLFTVLGAMIGFGIHAVIEMIYIKLLLRDFSAYSLGLTWAQWELVHAVAVPALTLLFGYLGYLQGVKWWRILYIQKKYAKRWGVNLKENF